VCVCVGWGRTLSGVEGAAGEATHAPSHTHPPSTHTGHRPAAGAPAIAHGRPDMDVTGMTPARFQRFHATPAFRRGASSEVRRMGVWGAAHSHPPHPASAAQALGYVYRTHYPTFPWLTARGVKRLPLHDRHAAMPRCASETSPAGRARTGRAPRRPAGDPATETPLLGAPLLVPHWAAEHAAASLLSARPCGARARPGRNFLCLGATRLLSAGSDPRASPPLAPGARAAGSHPT